MISIIIPTFNEADQILTTIGQVNQTRADEQFEIIIADGGSTDNTAALAKQSGAIVLNSTRKGRAAQMNTGAKQAKGDILYFLHADTVPPKGYLADIKEAVANGYAAGCFMLSFDHSHWFLKANCWFTRFDVDAIRFGDQSLFVTKTAFEQAGGFAEEHIVMEDQELIRRLRKKVRFKIIKKPVITSARKYLENGIYKTQGIFFLIFFLYKFGYSQHKLVRIYKKLMTQNKI
ncbi:TIGR04283 family arsenosugar biosynthesis glycosyltransferase [Mucilaginibacter sp. UYCu711]|uniref:TIGR04283 family arsenosugar biosynthesis glycosyltransferase n=1 Tax=Mucilaginibacter sp. UYCu711 TaxID=3156339 RepID=UPI003D19FDFF